MNLERTKERINELFEYKVRQLKVDKEFKKKHFDNFEIIKYLTINTEPIFNINEIDDFDFSGVDRCNYIIPIFGYTWLNDWGKTWKNYVQLFLCILEKTKTNIKIVENLKIDNSSIIFKDWHILGFNDGAADAVIRWSNTKESYTCPLTTNSNGVPDLYKVLSIARYCNYSKDVNGFLEFGYDNSANRSMKETILIKDLELKQLRDNIKDFCGSQETLIKKLVLQSS